VPRSTTPSWSRTPAPTGFHPTRASSSTTGIQAALIGEDPDEPGDYDEEVVLILDDWTDGWGESPKGLLAGFARDGMGGMNGMGGMSGWQVA